MKKIKCQHCGAENDHGAKTCDDCGRYLSGSKEVSRHDRFWGQCAWESDGMRCTNPGTMTDSTQGTDKWYCAGHHGCANGAIGHQIMLDALRHNPMPVFSLEKRRELSLRKVDKSVPEVYRGWSLEEYREYARKMIRMVGKKEHEGRYEWAKKIIRMHESREPVPFYTLKIARDRLNETNGVTV